jgi:uncharacterized protein
MDGGARPAPSELARLLERTRREILEVCDRHGASNVAVFGSVARGESNQSSDIDFLVDLDPRRSLLDHIGLQQDLEDLLGVRVDVVTRRGLHPLLRDAVLAEAVPV